MNLQLMRLDADMAFSGDHVCVLEIEQRSLYARICQSLLSEMGPDACEPYRLWDEAGKELSPKKRMLIVNSLPQLPYDNRTFLTKLYARVERVAEQSYATSDELKSKSQSLLGLIEGLSAGLSGEYGFTIDWNLGVLLKAFGFGPMCSEDESLIDNCMRFLAMYQDIGLTDTPIVLMGAKSFFDPNEVDQLYDAAVFHGVQLLLLESRHDPTFYKQESKTYIDEDLVVF